ncbi:MAG: hypothetical protein ACP5PS_01575 [Bacteroidales bacterium]
MPLIGILGITENTLMLARNLLQTGKYEIVLWDRNESISLSIPAEKTNNPFAVIANSDVLLIARKDEGSYGLIAEAIFALKPVVIDNLPMFTIREINDIIKLSHEAEIPVIPYVDQQLIAYTNLIHQHFPDDIFFVNATIKGVPSILRNVDPVFSLMLLLTLVFKGNILRSHVEAFHSHPPGSPLYFHFTFPSGSAALFYQPCSENEVFAFDVVGKNTTRCIDLLNLVKLEEPDHFACQPCGENLILELSSNRINNNLFNLYDLKLLLQAFKQAAKVLEDSHERMIR